MSVRSLTIADWRPSLIEPLNAKHEYRNSKQIRNSNDRMSKTEELPKHWFSVFMSFEVWSFGHCFGFRYSDFGFMR